MRGRNIEGKKQRERHKDRDRGERGKEIERSIEIAKEIII